MLAMNAPYSESSTHAIPLGGFLPHMDEACVWLCVTLSLLMPALLPVGDESLTNFRELRNAEVRLKSGPMGQDFSGSCIVTIRNCLIQKGVTTVTKSERSDPKRVQQGLLPRD